MAAGVIAGAVALFTAAQAHADNPNCSTVANRAAPATNGKIIWGAGGSAQLPLIQSIGSQLAQLQPPISIVYYSGGSACVGYDYLIEPTTSPTGTANYWDSTGAVGTCNIDTVPTTTFGVMGNAPNLCPDGNPLPAGYGQFLASVQPVDFVVPGGSSQTSISTEAAFDIWGYGAADNAHTVTPWVTTKSIYTRSSSSFVNIFVSLDTGVPASVIAGEGTQVKTNADTLTGLAGITGTAAEAGIGYVSGEVADGARDQIKVLAYQHTGQSCGYWPDSTIAAYDKANVRSGQYWLWSPVHFYAAVDGNGNITDAPTASFIGLFTGAAAAPTGVDVFEAEYEAYTVPKCAMQAWRDGDLAPPYSYVDPAPCSCKFDFRSSNINKPASCKTCTQDSDCGGTNKCRNIGPPLKGSTGTTNVGYCEVN